MYEAKLTIRENKKGQIFVRVDTDKAETKDSDISTAGFLILLCHDALSHFETIYNLERALPPIGGSGRVEGYWEKWYDSDPFELARKECGDEAEEDK